MSDLFGLQQLMTKPTRITESSSTLIDLIFANYVPIGLSVSAGQKAPCTVDLQYGFLSTLVKCLQIAQIQAEMFSLHLRNLALTSPIWTRLDHRVDSTYMSPVIRIFRLKQLIIFN